MQFSGNDLESSVDKKYDEDSDIESISEMTEDLKSSIHERMFLEAERIERDLKPLLVSAGGSKLGVFSLVLPAKLKIAPELDFVKGRCQFYHGSDTKTQTFQVQ